MASGIEIVVTQNGADATGVVGGGTATLLDLYFGGHSFTGTVSGNHLALELVGTRATTSGNCTYTYDATFNANALAGDLIYEPATNGQSDCAAVQCSSRQELSGSRPPR